MATMTTTATTFRRVCRCDDCAKRTWGVEFWARTAQGELAPVMFLCRECSPVNWDRASSTNPGE
jgi:hypothetical protein